MELFSIRIQRTFQLVSTTIRKSLYYSVFWQFFSPNNLHRCAPEPELVRMSEDIRERDDAIAEVVPTF